MECGPKRELVAWGREGAVWGGTLAVCVGWGDEKRDGTGSLLVGAWTVFLGRPGLRTMGWSVTGAGSAEDGALGVKDGLGVVKVSVGPRRRLRLRGGGEGGVLGTLGSGGVGRSGLMSSMRKLSDGLS